MSKISRDLTDPPPKDGIPIKHAEGKFHIAVATMWKHIDAKKLRAGIGQYRCGDQMLTCVLVSKRGVKRLVESKSTRGNSGFEGPPPRDGHPVNDLAREFGITDDAIRDWCRWEVHPGLGRAMKHGIGEFVMKVIDGRQRKWRGLLVSRSDVETCVALVRNPLHVQFPGNPGIWLSQGVFEHVSGEIYFSERHVGQNRSRWGMAPRSLQVPCYREKLNALQVTWPAPGPRDRWKLTVFSRKSLDALTERRNGKTSDGEWIDPNKLWRDSEGLWYSSMYLASLLGVSKVAKLRGEYGILTRYKEVPLLKPRIVDRWQKAAGRSPYVHHADEVQALLLGLSAMPGAAIEDVPAENAKVESVLSMGCLNEGGESMAHLQVKEGTAPQDLSVSEPAEKSNAGGAPRQLEVEKRYRYMYERWINGDKLEWIKAGVVKEFNVVISTSSITRDAKRYADRNGLSKVRRES